MQDERKSVPWYLKERRRTGVVCQLSQSQTGSGSDDSDHQIPPQVRAAGAPQTPERLSLGQVVSPRLKRAGSKLKKATIAAWGKTADRVEQGVESLVWETRQFAADVGEEIAAAKAANRKKEAEKQREEHEARILSQPSVPNDHETNRPGRFRLGVSRRMSRGHAEPRSCRGWRHRRRPQADCRAGTLGSEPGNFRSSAPADIHRTEKNCASSKKSTRQPGQAKSAPYCAATGFIRRPCASGRRQREAGTLGGLTPVKRGPKPTETNPLSAKLAASNPRKCAAAPAP